MLYIPKIYSILSIQIGFGSVCDIEESFCYSYCGSIYCQQRQLSVIIYGIKHDVVKFWKLKIYMKFNIFLKCGANQFSERFLKDFACLLPELNIFEVIENARI